MPYTWVIMGLLLIAEIIVRNRQEEEVWTVWCRKENKDRNTVPRSDTLFLTTPPQKTFCITSSFIFLQALCLVWTSTTCWSTMSMMWRISCKYTSCLQAGLSETCHWMWALWPEWAARRNTLSSSTSLPPLLHQAIPVFIYLSFSMSMNHIKYTSYSMQKRKYKYYCNYFSKNSIK